METPSTSGRIAKDLAFVLSCSILAALCLVFGVRQIREHYAQLSQSSPTYSDLDSNGVIESGYSVSVTDADPGSCPAGAYAYANAELDSLSYRISALDSDKTTVESLAHSNDIPRIRGAIDHSRFYLIPEMFGYRLLILSPRRLTKAEQDQFTALAEEAIKTAVDKWNGESFHKSKAWIP
jgi:hypothetical protein